MPAIEERAAATSAGVAEALRGCMGGSRTGVVLLFELTAPSASQRRWLVQEVRRLAPGAVLRAAQGHVLAVLMPGAGVAEGWHLMQVLRDLALAHHATLFAGLASWPGQGSTPVDVLASAAAALHDEASAFRLVAGEELRLELDGEEVSLGAAGELLTG